MQAADAEKGRKQWYTGALPDEFPGFFRLIILIDRQAKTATVAPCVVVPVPRPFFGLMGVAPLPATSMSM